MLSYLSVSSAPENANFLVDAHFNIPVANKNICESLWVRKWRFHGIELNSLPASALRSGIVCYQAAKN